MAVADGSAVSFVDGLWQHLQSSVGPYAENAFAKFVRRQKVTKWAISTDFCIGDGNRPNDSFAFVVFPLGEKMNATTALLAKIPPRDLKNVKRPPQRLIHLLRKGKIFTFCFLADRDRRLFRDAESARKSIDQTIEMMERWENAQECKDIIRQMRAMRIATNKNSVSTKLLTDIVLTTAFVSFIAALLVKYSGAERIGWAPDRDKITEAYSKVAFMMFSVDVSALCQKMSLAQPNLAIFAQTNDNLWCDPYIRIADYVAGAAAAWDPPAKTPVSKKVYDVITKAFGDNPYLFLFLLWFGFSGDQFRLSISRAGISSRPINTDGRRINDSGGPLRGRSRRWPEANAKPK